MSQMKTGWGNCPHCGRYSSYHSYAGKTTYYCLWSDGCGVVTLTGETKALWEEPIFYVPYLLVMACLILGGILVIGYVNGPVGIGMIVVGIVMLVVPLIIFMPE